MRGGGDGRPAGGPAVDKIAAARIWLLKEKPFFGVLARALRVEVAPGVAAFRLRPDDGLAIAPEAVLALRFPALTARLAHLSLHAALGAFARRDAREPLRWNLAHDLAIEPLLRAAGLGVGASAPGAPPLPDGASAEEHYAQLEEGTRPDDPWCDLADPEGAPDDPRREPGGDEGPVAMRSRALAWKVRLCEALAEEVASGGKTFGERPAWIDDLVRATVEPPAPFPALLQRGVAALTRAERSWLRPSRRLAALAGADGPWPEVPVIPGRRVRPAGRLVGVLDTSGSIDRATLGRFLGALSAAAAAEGIDEVRLVQADAEVTRDEVLTAAELGVAEVGIVGRGGTDLGPALRLLSAEARRQGERFTAVYLTDLRGPLPEPGEVAGVEVLWVVPGRPPTPPPFGQVLEMPPP